MLEWPWSLAWCHILCSCLHYQHSKKTIYIYVYIFTIYNILVPMIASISNLMFLTKNQFVIPFRTSWDLPLLSMRPDQWWDLRTWDYPDQETQHFVSHLVPIFSSRFWGPKKGRVPPKKNGFQVGLELGFIYIGVYKPQFPHFCNKAIEMGGATCFFPFFLRSAIFLGPTLKVIGHFLHFDELPKVNSPCRCGCGEPLNTHIFVM